MHVGLCTISNKEVAVAAVVETAADAGYDSVEVWGQDHIDDGSPETCQEIRRAVDDRGLAVSVYGSYLRLGSDEFADELDHELAVANRLDADRIRVWPGTEEYGDHDPDHWKRTVDDLRETTQMAASRDIAVTVEKHAGTLSNEAEGARRLIEAVDHPDCGLNYQPSFSLSPETLYGEARELAPLSNNVHVQAVAERGTVDRCPLSDSYFDVATVLEPFLADTFNGSVNVEFVHGGTDYETAVQKDLEYLRSLSP